MCSPFVANVSGVFFSFLHCGVSFCFQRAHCLKIWTPVFGLRGSPFHGGYLVLIFKVEYPFFPTCDEARSFLRFTTEVLQRNYPVDFVRECLGTDGDFFFGTF